MLIDCIRTQLRVIVALMLRETITRYGRHNIGFVWLFAEPMLFTLGITVLWNLVPHQPRGSISVTGFVLIGYSTILLWRNMPNRCVGAIAPNESLMFHRPVKAFDIYAARLSLEAAGATISLISLSLLFSLTEHMAPPADLLTAACGWILLTLYSAFVALLVGAISDRSEIFEKTFHMFQYFMIPLSGAFFSVESLPTDLKSLILLNPTVHCTELIRAGFFGPIESWTYDVNYVITVSLSVALVALYVLKWTPSKKEHSY